MYENIQDKQCCGPVMIEFYKKPCVLNIFGNNELRVLNFGYVMAADMTLM